MNSAGHFFGSAQGTQTATIAFGGQGSRPSGNGVDAEVWNGTNWTEVNNLNTGRNRLAGSGASGASALAFGGEAGSAVNNTEVWNGSNWTEVNNLNTARHFLGGLGTQTAALTFGGEGGTALTELWNGTNWTEVNDLNAGNTNGGAAGTTTSGLRYGGFPGPNARTESWNGTNWTELADLNTAGRAIGGTGPNNNSALAIGRGIPAARAATEEWNAGPATTAFTDA